MAQESGENVGCLMLGEFVDDASAAQGAGESPVQAQPKAYRLRFSGELLARGFWLYVWDVCAPGQRCLYVGRTGDSSSPKAQSPIGRLSQHLSLRPKAKSNALTKNLMRAGIEPTQCTFELLALGPFFPEQSTFALHTSIRNELAALERAVADLLRQRGYRVLGSHPKAGDVNHATLQSIVAMIDPVLPPLPNVSETEPERRP